MNQKQKLFSEFFLTMKKMRKLLDHTIDISPDKKISTMLQIQAMEYIQDHSGLTAGELATGLQMSSSAVTQLTDRLIDSDLISRKHSKIDRRAIHFELTSAGKKHLQESIELIKEKTSKILSPMSETDLEEVIRIFKNILKQHNK